MSRLGIEPATFRTRKVLRKGLFTKGSTLFHDFSQLGDVEILKTLFSTNILVKIDVKCILYAHRTFI